MNLDMQALHLVDYIFIGVVGFSTVLGLRGLIGEVLGLVGWIVTIYLAFTYGEGASDWIVVNIGHAPKIAPIMGYLIIFIAGLVVFAILRIFISRLIAKGGFQVSNRLLGLVFGFLRGLLICVVVVMMTNLTAVQKTEPWQQSLLIPELLVLGEQLAPYIPNNFGQTTITPNSEVSNDHPSRAPEGTFEMPTQ